MTIKQQGGVFGRNPTFNDVTIEGQLTFDGDIDVNSDLKVDGNLVVTGTGDFDGNLNVNAGDLVIDNGGVYITHSTDTAMGFFRSGANTFRFEHDTNQIYLWNATTSQAPILFKNDGNVELGVGNLKFNTAGKGIDFSATSGTGTSELFDDYEEGTWTPVVESSTPGTGTYTNQVGRYTKIGNRVFFNLNLNWSAHTGSGDMSITGLPFASNSTSGNAHSVSTFFTGFSTLLAGNILVPLVNANSSTISIYQTPAGGGSVGLVTLDTSAQVVISGHYEV